jgi:hypothetical protein
MYEREHVQCRGGGESDAGVEQFVDAAGDLQWGDV